MQTKEEIENTKKEVEEIKEEAYFFLNKLNHFKKTNERLFIANILLALALIIAIIGLIVKWTHTT